MFQAAIKGKLQELGAYIGEENGYRSRSCLKIQFNLVVHFIGFRWRTARLYYGDGSKQEKLCTDGRWPFSFSWNQHD